MGTIIWVQGEKNDARARKGGGLSPLLPPSSSPQTALATWGAVTNLAWEGPRQAHVTDEGRQRVNLDAAALACGLSSGFLGLLGLGVIGCVAQTIDEDKSQEFLCCR